MSFRAKLRAAQALAGSARREATADPASLLLLMTAVAAVHLAPAFQFHRLGEPGRLARDGGLSALLVFGGVFAAVAALRTVGREIESGVAAAALVRPVSRTMFVAAKTAGVVAAFARFAFALVAASALSAVSCVAGSRMEGDDGTACVSGVCLALGFGSEIFAVLCAALANRFGRRAFPSTCFSLVMWSQPLALAAALAFPLHREAAGDALLGQFLPAAVSVFAAVCAFACAASALSTRLRGAAAPAALALVAAASLLMPALVRAVPALAVLRAAVPDFGVYWLADQVSWRTGLAWTSAAAPVAASLCTAVFWTAAGALMFSNRDVS